MNTVVIEARNKSDVRFLHNFSKQNGAKIIDADEAFWNAVRRRLKEEDLLNSYVSENDVIESLKKFSKQRGFSIQTIAIDELLEEYEDAVFGIMMEERVNEPSENMEDVMEFLRQR